jgi:hypothetical protein
MGRERPILLAEASEKVSSLDHQATRRTGRTVGGFIQDASFGQGATLTWLSAARKYIVPGRSGIAAPQRPHAPRRAVRTVCGRCAAIVRVSIDGSVGTLVRWLSIRRAAPRFGGRSTLTG